VRTWKKHLWSRDVESRDANKVLEVDRCCDVRKCFASCKLRISLFWICFYFCWLAKRYSLSTKNSEFRSRFHIIFCPFILPHFYAITFLHIFCFSLRELLLELFYRAFSFKLRLVATNSSVHSAGSKTWMILILNVRVILQKWIMQRMSSWIAVNKNHQWLFSLL